MHWERRGMSIRPELHADKHFLSELPGKLGNILVFKTLKTLSSNYQTFYLQSHNICTQVTLQKTEEIP